MEYRRRHVERLARIDHPVAHATGFSFVYPLRNKSATHILLPAGRVKHTTPERQVNDEELQGIHRILKDHDNKLNSLLQVLLDTVAQTAELNQAMHEIAGVMEIAVVPISSPKSTYLN